MSWLFSQALVAEYSEANCSDGEPFAQSNGNPTPQAYLSPDRMTDFSRPSRFGMTFAPLTDDLGAALLTWFQAASPVKHLVAQQEAQTMLKTFGRKCGESWQMSLPGVSLPRTLRKGQLTMQQKTSAEWVTLPERLKSQRKTWVQTIAGTDIGYLHTPTVTANYCADSMMKHPSCRAFKRVFGKVTPESHEYLMGWPEGWTSLDALVMDKYPKPQP